MWSQDQIDGNLGSSSWAVALTSTGSAIFMLAVVFARLVQVNTLESSLTTVKSLLQTTSVVLRQAKSQLATAASALMPKSIILQHLRELKRQKQGGALPDDRL